MAPEKYEHLPTVEAQPAWAEGERPARSATRKVARGILYAVTLMLLGYHAIRLLGLSVPFMKGCHQGDHHKHHGKIPLKPVPTDGICVNPPVIEPPKDDSVYPIAYIKSEEYRAISAEKFSGALRVPTVSTEDLGQPGEDPAWDVFGEFHSYLEEKFPLVHSKLKKETINKFGLLFTWEGKDSSAKPIVLMAHQDVVPVPEETEHEWNYPPFSGHFDGRVIWGRGAVDDKNPLVSILESIELLLEKDFVPKRPVILAFGYDEESGGVHGAGALAAELESRYGPDSVHAVVDEGGSGVLRVKGTDVALVAVGEKGRYPAEITLYTAGGHGSIPPPHTGIGIAAELVQVIENSPYTPRLTPRNPLLAALQCLAVHSDNMSPQERQLLLNVDKSEAANAAVIDQLKDIHPMVLYNMQTSQAVNVFHAGVKINALPEKVTIRVDQRIAVEETIESIIEKLLGNIKQVANNHGLGVKYNGKTIVETQHEGQFFELTEVGPTLPPSPVAPIGTEAWNEFAGSVRYIFEEFSGPLLDLDAVLKRGETKFQQAHNLVVAPFLMTGNTDTRYFWNLSKNIYRFTPQRIEDDPGFHTVNEHISIEAHLETVAFYYLYLQNI
ncbi:carboxypeptidase S [Trichomonascus vanleenenianus]|uniref:M20 family metallopeptidase n=1 Tax=Trichomonascus vanleenenianus TaxID=2268995 RepID=UPI003ECB5A9F